jgi:hypothetical protein
MSFKNKEESVETYINDAIALKPWRKVKFDKVPTEMINKAFKTFNE